MSSSQDWWKGDARRHFRAFIRTLPAKHVMSALVFADLLDMRADLGGVLNSKRPAQVGETEEEWVDSFFFDESIARDDIARFREAASVVRACLDRAVACFDAGDAVGVVKALSEALFAESGFGSRASTDKAARALLRPGWEVFRDGIEFSAARQKSHLRRGSRTAEQPVEVATVPVK